MRVSFARALAWIMEDGAGPPEQRAYDAYRHIRSLPLRLVSEADRGELDHIYQTIWDAGCAGLAAGIDYLVFDRIVFAGRYVAVTLLWGTIGESGDDENDPRLWRAIDDRTPAQLVHGYTRARTELDLAVLRANAAVLRLTSDTPLAFEELAKATAEKARQRALTLLVPENRSGYSPIADEDDLDA